jgi:hypothetical protein
MRLDLVSEPVPESGGFIGFGVTRLLGTPKMDDLVLLVRESVQNSWDARVPASSSGTVNYSIDLYTLNKKQLRTLRTNVFAEVPEGGLDLSPVLDHSDVKVAVVTDTGTAGLNGPTRANEPNRNGESNFVNFIRNIGSPNKGDGSGGTYGFGKGSYYRPSSVRCIICHTRIRKSKHKAESRLIAAAVGEPFDGTLPGGDVGPHTGRHFWGAAAGNGTFAEPIVDKDADALAAALGFGVPAGKTGTSIMIVGFEPGAATGAASVDEGEEERTLRTAAEIAAHQLLWQAWPKLVNTQGTTPMSFSVSCEGEQINIPSLDASPILAQLVTHLEKVRDEERDLDVCRLTPKALLGRFSAKVFDLPEGTGGLGTESLVGFELPTHHIARMRSPELIIDYLPARPVDVPDWAWVGVFRANGDLDKVFAGSEPPTHDNWNPAAYPKRSDERSLITVAAKRLSEQVDKMLQPFAPPPPPPGEMDLGQAAAELAKAFATAGHGPSRPRNDMGGGRGIPSPLRFSRPQQRIEADPSGAATQVLTWEVVAAPSRAVDLAVEVSVMVDSGREIEHPAGAAEPQPPQWRDPNGNVQPRWTPKRLKEGDKIEIVMPLFADAALAFDLREVSTSSEAT